MTQSNADPPQAASDAKSDGVETCSVVGDSTGEPCGNPAILGTGFCHTHLDFTEIPAADDPADGEDRHRRQAHAKMNLST